MTLNSNMSNAIRKTIDFSDSMYEQIKAHCNEQGCRSFSEAIRDIIRTAKNHGLLASSEASSDPVFLQRRICKDTNNEAGASNANPQQKKNEKRANKIRKKNVQAARH